MTPGAVGFQCPECVSRGRRETRQGRLPYGGTPVRDPRATSIALIAINVLVWLAVALTGRQASSVFDALALLPEGMCRYGAEHFLPGVGQDACVGMGTHWAPGVATGAPWQVLTSGFTHEGIMHLGFNMFVVWMLGPQLEQILGRVRFLAVYLVSLLGGSAAVMVLSNPTSQTIGASGAIYGLLGAVLLLALRHQGDVKQILLWLGLNVAMTFVVPGISWQGHFGGLAAGLAVTAALVFAPKQARARWQWLAVAVVVAALVAVIAWRAMQLA